MGIADKIAVVHVECHWRRMMRVKPFRLAVLMLILAILACDLPEIPTPPPVTPTSEGTNGDLIATNVAATLTALAVTPASTPGPTTPPIETPPPCITAPVLTIAYTNNGNVWLVEGNNPPLQLTSGGTADWVTISGDGQKVAFTTWDQPTQTTELRVVNSDSTGETVLLSQAEQDALPPPLGGALHHTIHHMRFMPCTQDLLFNTRSVYEGPGLDTKNNLLSIDVNTGILTTILPPGDAGNDFFISPDRTRIALSFPERIGFADIDGSNLLPSAHTFTPVITYSEFMWNPPVRWAPDSSAVALAMPFEDPFMPGADGDIWHIPADGSAVTHLANIVADFYQIQTYEITISPDLSMLAYLRDSATPNVEEIYFANIDGSGEILYDTADLQPHGWSPDSINYAYIVSTLGGAELRIGRPSYAPLTIYTSTNALRDVSWVDNSRLLYFDGSHPNWDLKLTVMGTGTYTLASATGSFIPSYDFTPKP
jgi:Tol biopolymer transport system component